MGYVLRKPACGTIRNHELPLRTRWPSTTGFKALAHSHAPLKKIATSRHEPPARSQKTQLVLLLYNEITTLPKRPGAAKILHQLPLITPELPAASPGCHRFEPDWTRGCTGCERTPRPGEAQEPSFNGLARPAIHADLGCSGSNALPARRKRLFIRFAC